jgi:hypothetical protein
MAIVAGEIGGIFIALTAAGDLVVEEVLNVLRAADAPIEATATPKPFIRETIQDIFCSLDGSRQAKVNF